MEGYCEVELFRLFASGGSSFIRIGLGDFYKLGKRVEIINRQLRQRLPVQQDICALQAQYELAVVDVKAAGACADAGDPELTEFALFDPSVAIGIVERPVDGFPGYTVQSAPHAPVSLGELEQSVPASS